jgi:translation initiation factor IF-2
VSATIIVRQGTLRAEGFAVAGKTTAPLRIIEDFTGKKVKEVACGKPARVTGFTEAPAVGATLTVVPSKKEAEELAQGDAEKSIGVVRTKKSDDAGRETLRVLIKADTTGSLEALEYELQKIPRDGCEIIVVASGIGAISESDIKTLLGFSPAIAVGFNVKVEPVAKDLAERNGIIVETRAIIYELADWLMAKVKELTPAPPDVASGSVQILKHFSTTGSKHVVGGKVTLGILKVGERVVIARRGVEVGNGKIVNLQHNKADVPSVSEGSEFGMQIEAKADVIAGDVVSTATGTPYKK